MAHIPDGRIAEAGREALAKARAACTFDVKAMTHVLGNGAGACERREELAAVVRADPVFEQEDLIFASREERVANSWRVLAHTHRKLNELGIADSFMERRFFKGEVNQQTGAELHDSMFTMTLNGQMSAEQKKKWLPIVKAKGIIGTYAQTELGHGSNLRALETTATYDPKTQTWDIHTPCLTAAKWWPGGLGKTSTHAVLMARLITQGKDYGPHPFLVQLRRQEDHMPIPGVTVGDIGPKFGFTTQDNGFLLFNHVKVPHDSLLMRFTKVSKDGTFSKPPHAKLKYGTMIGIRAGIVIAASRQLAKACTIAVRYSCVRRQFASPALDGAEVSVIQYQTQQYKLLPLVAASYAFHFTGAYMAGLYMRLQANLEGDNFSNLAVVHATSSGLKALTTDIAANGIETCRKACGGHGYSKLSGLPELYTDYVAACTYEGENSLLCFQTSRYLIKQVKAAEGGATLSSAAQHLGPASRSALAGARCGAASAAQMCSIPVLVDMYRHRAARLSFAMADKFAAGVASGLDPVDARNAIGQDMIRGSMAHCKYVVLLRFAKAIDRTDTGSGLTPVLGKLCRLFGLYYAEQDLGDFLEDGYMSPRQAAWVRQGVAELMPQLLPEAVGLVDAWQFSDARLCSSLGRFDGDVYRDMFRRVQKAPLNRSQVGAGYKYIKPLLQKRKWPKLALDTGAPGALRSKL